ncbi:MAG: hypothetical protein EOO61_02705 [Hymenobacter sp.]|nr:MAG: hypothetical protein EOO61_02705 [Hymenobacter sp.]
MNQNTMISDFLSERMRCLEANRFITVSFCGLKGSRRLWKSDINETKTLFDLYGKRLSYEAFGRSRNLDRSPGNFLPVIAMPEYKTKSGDETYLHYHVVAKFPLNKAVKLSIFTHRFFKNMGVRHLSSLPDVKIKEAVRSEKAVGYSLKNIEDSFTVENTTFVGLVH